MKRHYCAMGGECPNVYCSRNVDWIHRLGQSDQARLSKTLADGVAYRPGMELRQEPHDISVG